jgi:hypothetical protein
MSNCVMENAQALAATANWGLSRIALKTCYSKFTRLTGLRPNPSKADRVKSISAAISPTAILA